MTRTAGLPRSEEDGCLRTQQVPNLLPEIFPPRAPDGWKILWLPPYCLLTSASFLCTSS